MTKVIADLVAHKDQLGRVGETVVIGQKMLAKDGSTYYLMDPLINLAALKEPGRNKVVVREEAA